SEAANFGGEAHPGHDARYDRADEFVEVVLGHWDSWEDDAIVFDRERGLFADPAKVHRLEHRGKWFRSRGPFTVPRSPQGPPVLLSEVLNYDFAGKGLDEPFSDAELAGLTGLQAIRDRVVRLSGKPNPTTRDFVQHSGRGTLAELPRFVGAPKDVADGLEEWFAGGACDGFVLAATHMPGAYEDFARLVVPELQRRGLFHREYPGATL